MITKLFLERYICTIKIHYMNINLIGEVFINPNNSEINSIVGYTNIFRGFLFETGDMIAFKSDILHADALSQLKDNKRVKHLFKTKFFGVTVEDKKNVIMYYLSIKCCDPNELTKQEKINLKNNLFEKNPRLKLKGLGI